MNSTEVQQHIENLELKDNKTRYESFLALQSLSERSDDCYKYFDLFIDKLASDNSYQRSIGLMMIAANVKWDKENAFDTIVDKYLNHINDEKFITSRQCIQSLVKIIPYKKSLLKKIEEKLKQLDYSSFKESQKNLIKKDVDNILSKIKQVT
ncbi:SufBD protein [Candidatus Dojkabacteria bacterium]|nr:SufBD protein [Candidatus Dojkabacteria bacterium]